MATIVDEKTLSSNGITVIENFEDLASEFELLLADITNDTDEDDLLISDVTKQQVNFDFKSINEN